MKYDPNQHHRRSTRLRDYDYGQAGTYFVTVCTHGRVSLFGEITDGDMVLNDLGEIVLSEWVRTPTMRTEVSLDAVVIMPNHVHGIVVIGEVDGVTGEGVYQYAPTDDRRPRSPSKNLGAVVRGIKATTTTRINQLRGACHQTVWQAGYYDHVIRNERELNAIRQYIMENPVRWEEDHDNPNGSGKKISKPWIR